MWDPPLADLAAITAPNKSAYCLRHGYAWHPHTHGFDASRPVAWSKLAFLRQRLPDYDWVMWSDVDSLITNPEVRIESLVRTHADLLLTRDRVGFNSGSFLVRNSAWSASFLDQLWNLPDTEEYRRHFEMWTDRLWENRAFLYLLRSFQNRAHARIVPQRRLNSYLPDPKRRDRRADHRPGDFVLHLPGMERGRRLEVLAQYARGLTDVPRSAEGACPRPPEPMPTNETPLA